MSPRVLALVGGFTSIMALGVAVAQILPSDRSRLTPLVLNPDQTPMRPAIRDVTPRSSEQSQTAPAEPPSAQAPPITVAPPPVAATPPPVPAPPAAPTAPGTAPVPRPAPAATRPATAQPSVLVVDADALDPRVRRSRERLLDAARSGDISRLNVAFQTSETYPIFTRGQERDPIAFWQQASGDGQGYEVLAILANILDLPAAVVDRGTAREMVVFPYLAHMPLDRLTPPQQVDLFRLMTAQDVRDMKTLNKWVFWRLGIGKDGTIHFFLAGE